MPGSNRDERAMVVRWRSRPAGMTRAGPPRDTGRVPGTASVSRDLDTLADRVRRLRPSHRDPEQFHIEKDEIERAMRRLARQAR